MSLEARYTRERFWSIATETDLSKRQKKEFTGKIQVLTGSSIILVPFITIIHQTLLENHVVRLMVTRKILRLSRSYLWGKIYWVI